MFLKITYNIKKVVYDLTKRVYRLLIISSEGPWAPGPWDHGTGTLGPWDRALGPGPGPGADAAPDISRMARPAPAPYKGGQPHREDHLYEYRIYRARAHGAPDGIQHGPQGLPPRRQRHQSGRGEGARGASEILTARRSRFRQRGHRERDSAEGH